MVVSSRSLSCYEGIAEDLATHGATSDPGLSTGSASLLSEVIRFR
jgi:hypothetical protein